MPTYCIFIDRRVVRGADKMNFSGPFDVFNKLKRYPSGYKALTSAQFESEEFRELEKDPNYRKVVVSGN